MSDEHRPAAQARGAGDQRSAFDRFALLENAARRSEEAAQEKLNVIAEALAALMASRAVEDPQLDKAAKKLREAVGLEERH